MGELLQYTKPPASAVDLIAIALRTVRERESTEAAMTCAEEMIIAAAAILARESGRRRARQALAKAALVLPCA